MVTDSLMCAGDRARTAGSFSKKQRCQDQCDRGEQLDQHVQGRPGRILERVADRIAHHGGLVRLRALPTELARFDEFLGVVPGASAVV